MLSGTLRAQLFAMLASILASGCTNVLEGAGGTGTGGSTLDAAFASGPRIVRLTHAQWENTVQDLFGLAEPPGIGRTFSPDPPLGRFVNNVDRLSVSANLWSDYQAAAETIAANVTDDAALLARLTEGLPSDATLGTKFVERFGRRAFRRALDANEVARYTQTFASGTSLYPGLAATTAGVRIVIESMLQSPYFINRIERSEAVVSGIIPLTGYELANRLSYTLVGSMPDDELLRAAEAGDLANATLLRAQVDRLISSPRYVAQFDDYFNQAFALSNYDEIAKNGTAFPEWNQATAEAARTEASLFLNKLQHGGGTVRDLFTSNKTFVNAELAAIYGLPGSFGEDFVEVELDPTQRAGFLTHVGFLAKNAGLTEPKPIHRGSQIIRRILCRDMNALVVDAGALVPTGDTNRERTESISGKGTCGESCHHSGINPLGFAFEAYDAVGRVRDNDNGFPLNTADTYVFEDGRRMQFANGVELSNLMAETPDVHACYLGQTLEFILGRSLTDTDTAIVEQLANASHADNMSLRDAVINVIMSKSFRTRSVE